MQFANYWIELGFGLFGIGLLIDFLDEYTNEPDLIDTRIERFIISAEIGIREAGTAGREARFEILVPERAFRHL